MSLHGTGECRDCFLPIGGSVIGKGHRSCPIGQSISEGILLLLVFILLGLGLLDLLSGLL